MTPEQIAERLIEIYHELRAMREPLVGESLYAEAILSCGIDCIHKAAAHVHLETFNRLRGNQ